MAKLTESQQPYTLDKTFKEDDRLHIDAVALVGDEGGQIGTALRPLPVQSDVLERIAASLERIEQHLSFTTELQLED